VATGIPIWLAGDCEHPDFAEAAAWLRSHCQCLNREALPAAIVVFQSRPGSVSGRQVESLHRLAPLARLLLVTGAWCDGERSNKLAAGASRIRWHQLRDRLPHALNLRLPRTASDGDHLERSLSGLVSANLRGGSVSIRTDCRTGYDVLADACRVLGLSPSWNVESEQKQVSSDLLVIDGWRNDLPAAGEALRMLLLDFPRPEDERRAAELGYAAVIAQPLLLSDLVAVLRRSGLAARGTAARVA
jgi:hypothetical protein